MNPDNQPLLNRTRRHFFNDCRIGLGAMALGSTMLNEQLLAAPRPHPLSSRPSHFPPKVKSVIYLFMAGGPSQLELFDFKPKLNQLEGKVIPESYVENKRFAFLKKDAKLLGIRRKFKQHGESGQHVSE